MVGLIFVQKILQPAAHRVSPLSLAYCGFVDLLAFYIGLVNSITVRQLQPKASSLLFAEPSRDSPVDVKIRGSRHTDIVRIRYLVKLSKDIRLTG